MGEAHERVEPAVEPLAGRAAGEVGDQPDAAGVVIGGLAAPWLANGFHDLGSEATKHHHGEGMAHAEKGRRGASRRLENRYAGAAFRTKIERSHYMHAFCKYVSHLCGK
jgi:hypothetical protein